MEILNENNNENEKKDLEAVELHQLSMLENTNKSDIYDKWSTNYDEYVKECQYNGPRELVQRLKVLLAFNGVKKESNKIKVLDFGCGTGLVGEEIKKSNLILILHGIDISNKMLEKAKEKKRYHQLFLKNLYEETLEERYDFIVSCGVFLEGHCKFDMIERLYQHLDSCGILLITVRDSYAESDRENFEKYVLYNI